MKIILDGRAMTTNAVLAMGFFDGVHVGHQVLLEKAKTLANQWEVPLVACSFSRHPLSLLAPDNCPKCIQTLEERLESLEKMGVDIFFSMPFNQALLDTPAEDYIGELYRRFHPLAIVCGYNHHFGAKSRGSTCLLEAIGNDLNFQTIVIPKICYDNLDVSSSIIRKLILNGDFNQVTNLLSRPYALKGCINKANEQYIFVKENNEKQMMCSGQYKVNIQYENTNCPEIVTVNEKEEIIFDTNINFANNNFVTLQFIDKIL